MKRLDHDEFDAMAVGWALHALEPDEEQAFAEHLAACDRCQQMVSDSETVLGDLAYDVPLVEPPPQVLARIREATGASNQSAASPQVAASPIPDTSLAPVVPLAPRRQRVRPLSAMAAVAAGLVLVALLGWNVSLQSKVDESEQVAAQRGQVIEQLGRSSTRAVLTDDANRTIGYVLQRGSAVEIIAGGLEANDPARNTYVLWAIQGSGQPPQAVGTFDVLRKSLDVRTVHGAAPQSDTFSGFSISKEPGRSVPQRPSQVVATGAVPT